MNRYDVYLEHRLEHGRTQEFVIEADCHENAARIISEITDIKLWKIVSIEIANDL